MSSPTHALDFAPEQHTAAGWRPLKRAWGVLCGTTFVSARAALYLLVLPLTAIACLTGIALYGVQSLFGVHRG